MRSVSKKCNIEKLNQPLVEQMLKITEILLLRLGAPKGRR